MSDIKFVECRLGPGEMEPREYPGHRLALQINGPVPMEVYRAGRPVIEKERPGRLALIPAGVTFGYRWSSELHCLITMLDPSLVTRIVLEVSDRFDVKLPERHSFEDPQITHLLTALRMDQAEGSPTGRLYTDTLVRALVLRLLACDVADRSFRLVPEAIRRVRDYIDAHLAENLSLTDLAAIAGLSPYHFARMFARATGLPPHQYLLARRLERAKADLAGSRRPIVEIALNLGFASQGHFHRAFRKYVGTTPGSHRRNG